MLDILGISLVSLINLVLGAAVFTRNTKSTVNRLYGFLVITVILWAGFNYFTNYPFSHDTALLVNRLSFASGILLLFGGWLFSVYFPRTNTSRLQTIFAIILLPLEFLFSLTPLIVKDISYNTTRLVTDITTGPLYVTYLFVAGLFFILMVKNYITSYRQQGITPKERQQIMYVGIGTLLTFIWIVTTTALIPALTGSWSISKQGYVGSLFLVSFTGYAVARHKLFDIRAVVVRSLTYLLVLGSAILAYGLFVFGIGARFSSTEGVSLQANIFYLVISILLAVSYQPIKRLFDKLTNKLFFRDAYNTQEVLDQVSTVIVGNIDPHKIQKGSLKALFEALRPTYAVFILSSANGENLKTGDIIGQHWSMHDQSSLRTVFKRLGKRIIVYDEIDDRNVKLKSTLRLEDISVVAPLVTKDEAIGYLLLGPKKSGNIYNSQDIGLLNIATNELAVALQNAQRFEEIKAFNVTLQEKVTEATRELKTTNKKLVALDEAKDEFISMASHQLRTPLTSIKGYLSMLLEGDLGKTSGPQEKALKEAFGSSQRMVYLIADFLNVSRIKTGKFMIEPKEVDLPQIVTEEITQLREMAGARDLTLEYEQPEVFPRVMLDDNKIRQVMMNMVDNAIYYTQTGGKITIQLYSTGDEIIFKVVDNGIGVPKREQHKLFTKFYRANNAKKARPDGTGLGLFMAQKIVVEQGGAIIFESTEGKGSTFGWRFPLAKIKVS